MVGFSPGGAQGPSQKTCGANGKVLKKFLKPSSWRIRRGTQGSTVFFGERRIIAFGPISMREETRPQSCGLALSLNCIEGNEKPTYVAPFLQNPSKFKKL